MAKIEQCEANIEIARRVIRFLKSKANPDDSFLLERFGHRNSMLTADGFNVDLATADTPEVARKVETIYLHRPYGITLPASCIVLNKEPSQTKEPSQNHDPIQIKPYYFVDLQGNGVLAEEAYTEAVRRIVRVRKIVTYHPDKSRFRSLNDQDRSKLDSIMDQIEANQQSVTSPTPRARILRLI